ncbi:MAG: DUF6064 family protein [Kiloniellaceae bacterium]
MFPFDAEVLASSYALYNAAIWPAQVFALAIALAAVWLTVSPRRGGGRAVGALLAAGWLWCGLVFFQQHLAQLDFMAPIYGWAFVAQAGLLLWALVWRPPALRAVTSIASMTALVLAAAAIFGLPLVAGLGDAGFASARIVGLAPDPTVLFTLALLLVVEGRATWLLLVIPLLWCGVAAVTGWMLGVPESLALAILALPAYGLLLRPARRPA